MRSDPVHSLRCGCVPRRYGARGPGAPAPGGTAGPPPAATRPATIRRAATRRGAGAFSLIEIVLVLVILALVSAIAVPRYGNSIMRYRAESAARRVAQDLALAQAHAANAGRPQPVVFVARGYQMPGMPHLNGKGYGDYTVDLGSEPYGVTRVAAEFGGDGRVTFDLYGAPDTGGSVVVEVGDVRRVIVLRPDTGRVQVK